MAGKTGNRGGSSKFRGRKAETRTCSFVARSSGSPEEKYAQRSIVERIFLLSWRARPAQKWLQAIDVSSWLISYPNNDRAASFITSC